SELVFCVSSLSEPVFIRKQNLLLNHLMIVVIRTLTFFDSG
ncbi:hypothetical protein A2U01_0053664, partial [Trifolium medium]|nr:hypothetical protein [Trifolium medium]